MVKAELGESAKSFKSLRCQIEPKAKANFNKVWTEEVGKLMAESENA